MLDALARGLGLADFLPEGPVLTPAQRSARFGRVVPSGAVYAGPARVDTPIRPVQVFGVAYERDLMLVSDHPSWNMHEYARILTPDGPVWMMKDAREHTLAQSIVADRADLASRLPEVPVVRRRSPVAVVDRSTEDRLDVELAYTNLDGESVEVAFEGPQPTRMEARRNSSTMGHSRDAVLAVLDLSHKAMARRAAITIDGRRRRLKRLLGLVPMRFALVQTQGGFSVGSWVQHDGAGGGHTLFEGGIREDWTRTEDGPVVELSTRDGWRTLRYRFARHGGRLELFHVRVEQYGVSVPTVDVAFHPAVPDLRAPLGARWSGHWVVDVQGQASHATGTIGLSPDGDTIRSRVFATAPRWCLDRPLVGEIRGVEGGVAVRYGMQRGGAA